MGYGPVSLVFHILSTQRKECPFLLRFGVSGVGGLGVGGLEIGDSIPPNGEERNCDLSMHGNGLFLIA